MVKKILTIPKRAALLLIKMYQKTLSTDHSFWAKPEKFRICIYSPSCSEYTYQAIERFGLIKGGLMGTARIIRCNPFAEPGFDMVPDKFSLKRNKII
jgi:uncharacterized protein